MLLLLFLSLVLVIGLQSYAFRLSQKTDKKDIADIFWGLGIVMLTVFALVWNGFESGQLWLVTILTGLWGLRLAYHIRQKNKGKEDDRRYQEMSKDWENQPLQTYLKVFLLQGVLMIVLASSALSLSLDISGSSLALTSLGVLVWLIGFGLEILGDEELKQFKKNPANQGKILTTGTWNYTRHPNYFGEVLLWWGIWLIALPNTYWWWSILTPIAITFLILKVSGIPMAEAHYDAQNRDDWKQYKARTNKFFPGLPKL